MRRAATRPRQPRTEITTAAPLEAIHHHNRCGAGSSARPAAVTYQCAQPATPAPTAAAAGSHSSRQRRERHPAASSSVVTVTAWTVPGIQPCINDVW